MSTGRRLPVNCSEKTAKPSEKPATNTVRQPVARRVGGFDAVASRYGVMVQGADKIALAKAFDVLSILDKIPVCVVMRRDGKKN